MVDYEYEELFENHSRVDLLIVENGASISWNSTTQQFDVEDSDVVIRTDDIESESFELDEKLCSSDNLEFGLCESAHFNFTMYNRTTVPNLKDKLIDVFIYFNNDPNTIFVVGQYQVDEDSYTAGRRQRNVSAYDLLYYLRDLDITDWYNQYYTSNPTGGVAGWVIMNLFAWINGTTPYQNDDTSPRISIEIDDSYVLCNGDYVVPKTIESDTITFGFFMQGILELNGAFGHINRTGKLEFKTMEPFTAAPVRDITDETRFPPTNYDDVNTWGIGGIDVYDRTNIRKFKYRNTDKKHPSIYVMIDPWILADKEKGDTTAKNAIKKMHDAIQHQNYNPSETECTGDLCVEVGDRIDVHFAPVEGDTRDWFRSYVLERHFAGLQGMVDTYTAKGNKKQPKYKIKNSNWHNGDSDSSIQGTGGVAEYDSKDDNELIEKLRNVGIRLLDEPSNVSVIYNKAQGQVEIKWTDPSDITDYKPLPCEWIGTCVIRKESEPPKHRWDGTLIVRSTTRNEYSSDAYEDNTIETNKKYYYAIMPYYKALDDEDHPIRYYRWTKVLSVDTERILTAPTIYPIQDTQISGTTVTVAYTIPTLTEGSYTLKKLVVKKNSIPTSKTDGDKIIDLTPDPSMLINGVEVSGLDENSTYYFVIFIEDEIGSSASSEPQSASTTVDEGWNYDYTGQIQTFVAPKTGIYQLETWGAQGGDATDGTLTARGGYGAYAVGEVFLSQGETLYINVGGQNGYGGGGLARKGTRQLIQILADNTQASLLEVTDKTVYTNTSGWGTKIYDSNNVPSWISDFGTNWNVFTRPYVTDASAKDYYINHSDVSIRRRGKVTSRQVNAVFFAYNNGTEINGYTVNQSATENDSMGIYFGVLLDDDSQKGYMLLVTKGLGDGGTYKAWIHNSDSTACSAIYESLKYS